MKKEELSSTLKNVRSKIEELTNLPKPVYMLNGKYVEKHGMVSELYNQLACAKAFQFIKSQFIDLDDVISELGIVIKKKELPKYMGFSFEDWKSEFQKRVTELQIEEQLNELKNAENVLMKHRTEDDVFNEDVDGISDILKTV